MWEQKLQTNRLKVAERGFPEKVHCSFITDYLHFDEFKCKFQVRVQHAKLIALLASRPTSFPLRVKQTRQCKHAVKLAMLKAI
jgi:hypothetical protein